jgi:hypothetical protein
MPTIRAVHHIAVQVQDLEQSRAFWCALLGLAEVRRQPHALWCQAGDTLVMLERAPADASDDDDRAPPPFRSKRRGAHLIALTIDVDEREAWRARLAEAGVPLEKESDYTLYVRDPDGTRVGLSHYPTPARSLHSTS